MALSLCSPWEGIEQFCVPGTVDSEWGFRGEEDLPLLYRCSQSIGETDNRPDVTVLLPRPGSHLDRPWPLVPPTVIINPPVHYYTLLYPIGCLMGCLNDPASK